MKNFQTRREFHREKARKLFLQMEAVHDKTGLGKARWEYLYNKYCVELDKALVVKSIAA